MESVKKVEVVKKVETVKKPEVKKSDEAKIIVLIPVGIPGMGKTVFI